MRTPLAALLLFLCTACLCSPGLAQDRTLTLYTSLAPTESGPLAQAFEKKTGIKVELWRAISEKGVAGDQRGGGPAPHPRGAPPPLQRRRRRDQRPGDGDDGPREALRRARLGLSRRPPGGRGAEAPLVDSRPHEFLRGCLQHGESAARGAAEELSRLSRPEVEGPHRHRGDRRRMDGDAG